MHFLELQQFCKVKWQWFSKKEKKQKKRNKQTNNPMEVRKVKKTKFSRTSPFLTFVLAVGIEEEDALHKVLVEHPRVLHLQQVEQAKLRKAAHLRVHERAHNVEEKRTLPLDVVLLKKASQQGQSLPPHQQGLVPQGRGDGWQERVHSGGVADGQVAQDDDDVVPYGRVLGGAELAHHLNDGALGEVLVLQAKLPYKQRR